MECSCLVENHEKIRELSMTHKNVDKVLDELEDIIDLPARWGQLQHMHVSPRYVAMCRDQHPCSYQSCCTSIINGKKGCGSPCLQPLAAACLMVLLRPPDPLLPWFALACCRADMVLEMLEDDTNLLRSFEGLIMLEGTASNAKQAWNRWAAHAMQPHQHPCHQGVL